MRYLARKGKTLLLAAVLCSAWSAESEAQEFSVLGGALAGTDQGGGSYSWQLAYTSRMNDHLAWGITYLNEGHLAKHHRDGYAPLLITHVDLLERKVNLAAGVGPYLFFDTFRSAANRHGLKGIASLAGTWYLEKNWFLQLRSNIVAAGEDIDTISALAGIGYRFPEEPSPGGATATSTRRENELMPFLGQVIANRSGRTWSAAGVQYRRHLRPHLDGTLAFLIEGDNKWIRRHGLLAQVWGSHDLFPGKVDVGIGIGPYLRIASYHSPPADDLASGVITLTGSYRLSPRWSLRASWDRFFTNSDNDADLISLGVGHLF